MNISIKKRISWGFSLLVFLFALNGTITILTLKNNNKLSTTLSKINDPSPAILEDLQKLMLESKMSITSWAFLKSSQEDKERLKKLHDSEYPALKSKITEYSLQWENKQIADSVNSILISFEELLHIEESIMASLKEPKDYNAPGIKLMTEEKVEKDILPRTAALINALNVIQGRYIKTRTEQVGRNSTNFVWFIILSIAIIGVGLLLTMYLTKLITGPFNRIRYIINNLGKGIIRKIDQKSNTTEIGMMVHSVNNLSERLQATATFAQETGLRNFDVPFKPLGEEDTLGKALIAMRDNLKASERLLLDSNREFEILFNSIDEVFFSVDMVNYKVIQVSNSCEKLYGYKPSDFIANHLLWLNIIHPDDKHIIENEDVRMQRGEQINNQYRIIRKDNNIRWVETKLTPSLNSEGTLIRVDGFTRDITERKKTEETLNITRFTFENASHAIYWIKDDGSFFNLNNAACKMLGYTCNELLQLGVPDIDPDYNKEKWPQHWEDLRDKKLITLITKQRHKSGKLIDVQVDAHFFKFDDLEMNCAFVYDITERKTYEELLQKSEANLRSILENTDTSYILVDTQIKILSFNHAASCWAGKELRITLKDGDQLDSKFLDLRREDLKKKMAEVLSGNKVSYEIGYTQGNRSDNYYSVVLNPILDSYRKVLGVCISLDDITERKKAETQLYNSEERYRNIVETSQEGIWLIDDKIKTLFVNKKMCELLQYSSEEMIGKKIFDFMDEAGKQLAIETLGRMRNGPGEKMEFRFIMKNGKYLWTYVSVNSVFDDAGIHQGGLAMVTDITDRKHDEELLQKSRIRLEKNNRELEQKNKELEQFAYVASHDLQEPLRTTSSFVELLQKQYSNKLDDRANKYLGFITHSSDRMGVLINDLLEYSRIGNKRDFKQVDCNLVLQEVLADLNTAITESQAEIKSYELPVISGYPTEIKQLFQNLIINAIKFCKAGSRPHINFSAQTTQDYWEFSCRDNGIGIEKKDQERIFIIFQRLHTRKDYPGSGIGLSHCKKIVELHGGKIWAESVIGEGTTFHFTIFKNHNQ